MGDQSGQMISTAAEIDHVASDRKWLWCLSHVKYVYELSRYLSRVVEIWGLIFSAMFV